MSATYYANAPLPDTNARQGAMTMRPATTALLTIDSEDRYQNYEQTRANLTSPYNFSINKSESLMPGFMTRLGVSEICFPWTVPNINVKTNRINFAYVVGGGGVFAGVITLPIGFYTPVGLAAALQGEIRAAVPQANLFTVTYGAGPPVGAFVGNLPVFSYNTTNTDTVLFAPFTYNSAAYPYGPNTKQLFDILGFGLEQLVNATSGLGTFTYCQAIRYIDVVCNQLTNSQAQKDQTSQTVARDMLCRLYLGSGAGDGQSTVQPSDPAFCPPGCAPTTIYRNFTLPKQIQWIPNQNIPGYLQFQIYDDSGDLLDTSLTIGTFGAPPVIPGYRAGEFTDWSMTLLITEN